MTVDPHHAPEASHHLDPAATRRAVIDIGTNSVKLLIGEVQGETVHPLHEEGQQTRLGRGFYETHQLRAEAIAHTARVVAEFAARARSNGVPVPMAIATSAARDASNAHELLSAIRAAAGLEVRVIDGDTEADWAFRGVTTDPGLREQELLILDLGGGSTEFILGCGRTQSFRHSFPIGTVRLFERLRPHDPPTPGDWERTRHELLRILANEVDAALGDHSPRRRGGPCQLVGTGGTAGILGRMRHALSTFDRTLIEGTRLPLSWIYQQRERAWSMPLAARQNTPGLPADRADIILMGMAVYEVVMEYFALPDLHVSTRGLRFAALME